MSIKFVSILALAVSSSIAAPTIWDGTANTDWYKDNAQAYNITTAEELAGLAELVNNGNTFAGKTIILGADIFLNDTAGAGAGTWASIARTPWTPIGTETRPFMGEFDGIAGKKNRKIYGLYFNDTTKSNVGLFGYTNGVKISNLDLPVGRVTAANNTGALVGYAASGSITNVHSEVKVTGKNKVGGLVGYSTGSLNRVSVQENVLGQDSVGGLVGYTSGSIVGTTKDSCFFVGNVNGRKYVGGAAGYGYSISHTFVVGNVKGDSSYVGGLAGYATSGIITSYHTGGNVTGHGYVGGLVGYTNKKIESSYHNGGDVLGKWRYVGGVAGYAGTIRISYAEGNVEGDSSYVGGLAGYTTGVIDSSHHTDGDVTGLNYVGGLVGYTNKKVQSSYHNGGDVFGKWGYVGGVAGYADTIRFSYAEGNVKGGSSYVGGLAGYATGVMDSSHHTDGDLMGFGYVGGLVGYTSKKVQSSYHNGGDVFGKWRYVGGVAGYADTIRISYAEGSVKGDSSYVGGLAGYATGVIDSSHHTDGDVTGYDYVGGLIGYSKANVVKSFSKGSVEGGNYVGGLVGSSDYYFNGNTQTKIYSASNSYFIGDVKGVDFVGGLIGKDSLYRFSSNTSNVYKFISDSYAKGNVVGRNYVGGIVGCKADASSNSKVAQYNNVRIIDSYHKEGSVEGTSYVGGIAGFTTGEITSSHSEGDVSGTSFVGGVIGKSFYRYVDTTSRTFNVLTNSYSIGNVTGSNFVGGAIGSDSIYREAYNGKSLQRLVKNVNTWGTVEGRTYVGGLIGRMGYGYLASSYSYNFLASVDSCAHFEGDVIGSGNYVGGVVGSTYASINHSHSEGSVGGKGNYVGGLAGTSSSIRNSYHKSGDVSGASYVGGLAGSSGYVSSSYSEGNVTGSGSYVGGLAGASGSVSNSYHKSGDVSGNSYVGGLSGVGSITFGVSFSGGNVSNSYSEGNVAGAGNYIGGLFGLLRYSRQTSSAGVIYDTVVVKESYSIGNVSGLDYVGGLIGKDSLHKALEKNTVYNYNTKSLFIYVSNTYSKGSVEGRKYVGGLIGLQDRGCDTAKYVNNTYFSALIDSSYHINGFVKGDSDYVGGLIGSTYGNVKKSHTEGSVRGHNTVGGLAGYVLGSIDESHSASDSVIGVFEVGGLVGYAASTVDSSYATANVKGDDNVGGLIGSAYSNVSYSYALGNVDGDGEGAGAGHDNIGGLVGYQYSGSISKSMALGNVTGTTKLGGLVGRFDGASIDNSYANGNVTGNYYGDPADEVGNYYIGGLVGYAKGSLNETYSSGIVKGIDEDPVYTGCMVGYVNGYLYIKKSYYDKSKCSLGIDGGEESVTLAGTPDKTTAEMQTQSTFEDWDFVDTWKIIDDSYPFLQSYANSLTNATVETATLEGYKYDGTAKTPLVLSVKLFGETLEYETEYTIAYENNVNAGTAHIKVCGVKPYGGCKVVDFEIAAIPVEPTIAAIENMTYTGRALTPEIKVYNGETLLAATDYTVEYKDNVNAGTATVSVTMKGNYGGSASKTFTIEKAMPVISQNPKASDIVLGETLAKSELTGGLANVEGSFAWKNSEVKPTLENEGYAVVFTPTDTANYTNSEEIVMPIKVLDMVYIAVHAGETTVDSSVIEKGGKYTIPTVPDSAGHDFIGVYNGAEKIGTTGDVITVSGNVVLEAKYAPKKYVVAFVNGSTELQSGEVAYGTLPKYSGDTPVKDATAKYTYTFKDWTPAIETVSKATTYTAAFDSVVNEYVIIFMDGEIELQSGKVAYGVVPTAPEVTLPENTAQCSYSFGGWDKKVVSVTGAETYTAVINCVENKYSVTFKNYNGTVLKSTTSYTYGTSASNISKPSNPTRTSTAQFAYSFKDWNPTISDVIEDVVYVAEYDSTIRSYTIKFVNGSEILQSDVLEYGSMPSYDGDVPTKAASTKYTYTFASWSPKIAAVTGSATYKAVFDSTKIVVSSSSVMASSSSAKQSSSSVSSSSSSSKMVSSSSKTESSSSIARSSSSSKIMSSSSKIQSSSSARSSSSSVWYYSSGSIIGSSSSSGFTSIAMLVVEPQFDVSIGFRSVQIAGAKVGSTYALLDLQGRVLQKGRIESANFNIAVPQSGSYLVRINKQTTPVNVK